MYSDVDIEEYKRANLDENGRCISKTSRPTRVEPWKTKPRS